MVVGLIAVNAACASKNIPATVVGAPKFPQFTQPPVPESLAASSAVTAYNLGWRLFQEGDLKTAERAFATSLKASPSFYPAETAAGYLELSRSEPKAALPHFDRALEQRGDYPSALVGRGQALASLERESEAVAAFTAALAADPSLVDLSRRIEVLRFKGVEKDLAAARQAARSGNSDDAIRAYQAAIATSPDSAFLYRELAAVEAQKGEFDLALTHVRQATTLDPADAAAFAQMGDLLEGRGDVEGALAAYASSLNLETSEAVAARRDAVRARAALAALPEQYRAIAGAPQVTRGDLAALIGVRLAALLQPVRTGDAVVVTDLRANWAEPWIMTVVRAGVIDPYENHTFQPAVVVRRVDLAQATSRLLQRLSVTAPTRARPWENARERFADMTQGHLAYPAASVAVAAGVMAVGSDQMFQPSRVVTGPEAVQAVRRLETLAGLPSARDNSRP